MIFTPRGLQRPETLNALLNALDHCGQWQLAITLLWQLPADVVSYSSVVSSCARAAQWSQALELVCTMEADEVGRKMSLKGSRSGFRDQMFT